MPPAAHDPCADAFRTIAICVHKVLPLAALTLFVVLLITLVSVHARKAYEIIFVLIEFR